MSSANDAPLSVLKQLDSTLYSNITQDDLAFFRKAVAINRSHGKEEHADDDETIKTHILDIQTKAYAVHNYNCIRRFAFIRPKIAYLAGYHHALELLKTRENPILADIGCCFGNDIRKAAMDGWPTQNLLACDLRREFWDIGHALFKSTPETFPVKFIQGDIFNDTFFSPGSSAASNSAGIDLTAIESLTPLRGKISAIHASSLFHLFDEDQQLALAKRLSTLLLLEPGSIIFGSHGGRPVKGLRIEAPPRLRKDAVERYMFCHSPESWKKLWCEDVFSQEQGVKVRVEAELAQVERKDLGFARANESEDKANEENKFWAMKWFV
ncbi:hypothetical protein CPC08DRAFT_759665 [Agrocybe pediades]|nr:hypothetical protein CPC08DRAFT_759665 [Agrocybe pediades]